MMYTQSKQYIMLDNYGISSVGRASAFQAEGREFEPRRDQTKKKNSG